MLLRDKGYAVEVAASPQEALETLRGAAFDLILMDLNYARDTTSGEEGLALIGAIRERDSLLPVVVMTAYGNVDIAVQVMQRGADDFIEKPWDNYRLLQVIQGRLELAASRRRERQLEAAHQGLVTQQHDEVIARSEPMRAVLEMVDRIAQADVSVLITGENGVGKGVVARALHRASSRAAAPLIAVDMGTLSESLIEAELFGHEPGAFTDAKKQRVGRFEAADGGTLFLDEIGNFPLAQQTKLLRVIETGEFERLGSSTARSTDMRLICATNADLPSEVAAGRFRQDLYYRLHTVEIPIPPLRERPEDVEALAEHLLARFNAKYRRRVRGFSQASRRAMLEYGWPGNVRELSHAVERATLLCGGETIDAEALRLDPAHSATSVASEAATSGPLPSGWQRWSLERMERWMICRALAEESGQVSEAARRLGLSRSAMYRRLERFELSVDQAIREAYDPAGGGASLRS